MPGQRTQVADPIHIKLNTLQLRPPIAGRRADPQAPPTGCAERRGPARRKTPV